MHNNRRTSLLKIPLNVLMSFAVLSSLAQVTGSTYRESKQSKTASFVYVYDNVPHFAEPKDDKAVGLVVDIMMAFEEYLERKEGIQVSTTYMLKPDFSSFMTEVKRGSGAVFGLSNISMSEERKDIYSFSPPYLDNVSLLLSSAQVSNLTELANIQKEFDRMVAYSLPGSSYLKRLHDIRNKHYPDMQIVLLSKESEVIEKLITEPNAFAILDVNYYIDILKKKQKIKRHSAGDNQDDQYGIIMPKSSDWATVLEEFFNSELIGSNQFSKIVSDNLGSTALRLLDSIKKK